MEATYVFSITTSTENFIRETSNVITIFYKINQVYHEDHRKSHVGPCRQEKLVHVREESSLKKKTWGSEENIL